MTVHAANKRSCSECGQSVNLREIPLLAMMVEGLRDVFEWCQASGRWLAVKRAEFKNCFRSESLSAHFGDWKTIAPELCGSNKKRGFYDFNRKAITEFFRGELRVPARVWHDPLTGTYTPEDLRFVNEIPALKTFLTDNEEFIARYRDADVGSLAL